MQPWLLAHCPWLMLWGLVYLIWSVIHDASRMGGGGLTGPLNVTYIYPVLDWDAHASTAGLLSAIVILIVIPVLYSILWCTNFARFQAIYQLHGLAKPKGAVAAADPAEQDPMP